MNTLRQLILFPVGAVAFTLLGLVGFVYTFVLHVFIRRDYSFSKQFVPIVQSLTQIFNRMGNALAGELLNHINLKTKKNGGLYKKTYKYGKSKDMISEVTGVNKKRGLLSTFGKRFDSMLEFTLGVNHSLETIDEDKRYEI